MNVVWPLSIAMSKKVKSNLRRKRGFQFVLPSSEKYFQQIVLAIFMVKYKLLGFNNYGQQ